MANSFNPYVPQSGGSAGGIGTQNTGTATNGVGVDGGSYQVTPTYKGGKGTQQDHNTAVASTWGSTFNAAKPWLTNSQAAADTRNNFYYGGSPNGADDFNNKVATVGVNQSQNFANDSANAIGLAQNAGAYGQQAGAAQQSAMGRDPGRFLDQSGMANNGADRGAQLNAIGGLNNAMGGLNQYIANGPGPSAAQGQLNQATDANMANSLAMARSGRGMGQSQSAMRQAIGQNAMTGQQAANQSAVLSAQEGQNWQQNQLNAYGQIGNMANAAGGIAGNARAGDLGQSSYFTGSQQAGSNANDQTGLGYAGIQQGYGQQQLGANGQSLAANTAMAQSQNSLLGLQNSVNNSQMNGNMQYEGQQLGSYLGQRQPIQSNGNDWTPYIQAGAAVLPALAML